MSYERTKPTPDAIATNRGWVDAKTGELLVAISNLDVKLKFGNIDGSGTVVADPFNQPKKKQRLVEPAPVVESVSPTAELLVEPAPEAAFIEEEILSEPAPEILTEKKSKKSK